MRRLSLVERKLLYSDCKPHYSNKFIGLACQIRIRQVYLQAPPPLTCSSACLPPPTTAHLHAYPPHTHTHLLISVPTLPPSSLICVPTPLLHLHSLESFTAPCYIMCCPPPSSHHHLPPSVTATPHQPCYSHHHLPPSVTATPHQPIHSPSSSFSHQQANTSAVATASLLTPLPALPAASDLPRSRQAPTPP